MKIEKPLITISVIIVVILAIVLIEYQKPQENQITQQTKEQTVQTNQNNNTQNQKEIKSNTEQISPEIKQIIKEKEKNYKQAPKFKGIEHWINSPELTMQELKGKVVLIDFWTYSCINCLRTLPYLKQWDNKYKNAGLIIIGVHTPEFDFEKKYENVVAAAQKYELKFAIAQDNNFLTWYAYQNRYWPHKFLIDIDGFIVYEHIGEGNYEETEQVIQQLLKERLKRLQLKQELNTTITAPNNIQTIDMQQSLTPEIYFGYKFYRGNFGNEQGLIPEESINYTIPKKTEQNNAYFTGTWLNKPDYMELISDSGEILLPYQAKAVNIVAEAESQTQITVLKDESLVNQANKGTDLSENSTTIIKDSKLYNLIYAQNYSKNTIKIKATKGFRIFTFTFG